MSSSTAELTAVVTRALHQAGALSDLLRDKGVRVIELPTIAVAEPQDWAPFDRAMRAIESFDAVLIGSKNAADAVRARGFSIPIPICAVGKKTKRELEAMPQTFTGAIFSGEAQRAEGMVAALRDRFAPLRGRRFLFLRAPEGREVAIELLEAEGAIVEPVAAYRIVPAPPADPSTLDALEHADVFTFLSGETLACFLQVVPEPIARSLLARKQVAVIGPVAMERAESLGIRVDLVPAEPTIEALVRVLTERSSQVAP
jgi:uroporphyrinogen III methyltransferase/synthase